MKSSEIEVATNGAISVVTLNRPAKRNALTLAMWRETASVFRQLGNDRSVRAIILRGAGGNFSVGADVAEFSAVRATERQSDDYEVAVEAAADAIASVPKPVVAVLEGYCLGGACLLSMACDFRFAGQDVQIGIPAAKLSIVYGVGGTQRLLSLVGLTRAKRLLFTAERLGADVALDIGFVDRVCSDPAAEAEKQAELMAALAPLSIAGSKKILTGLTMGVGVLDEAAARALIGQASASEDYLEGRTAFAEKRAPHFKNR